jgi:hypothetical protein
VEHEVYLDNKIYKMKPAVTLLIIAAFFADCGNSYGEKYSFFVAGHTYGPGGWDIKGLHIKGLHPPFTAKFDWIKNQTSIEFGVLTGDIVYAGTEERWDAVDAAISSIGLPVHFAAGNHDLKNRELFENRYGRTYYSFSHGNDLFIVLDPNIDGWNISGEQLVFLEDLVGGGGNENIFIFFHQMLWWEADNAYRYILPNSKAGREENINFWTEIEPILTESNRNIVLFAGDIGAFPFWPDYRAFMYHEHKNLTLIASGMGGCKQDNFIVVNVLDAGEIDFQLVSLNDGDNIDALGDLEDFSLAGVKKPVSKPSSEAMREQTKEFLEKCLNKTKK